MIRADRQTDGVDLQRANAQQDTAGLLVRLGPVLLHAGRTLQMVFMSSCSERGLKTVTIGVFWHVAAPSIGNDVSEEHTASTFRSDTPLATGRLLVVACILSAKGRTVDERRVKVWRSY